MGPIIKRIPEKQFTGLLILSQDIANFINLQFSDLMSSFKISDLRNKHFLSLAGNGVIAVFAFGLIGLLTRSLSKADVGAWFFFLMVYNLGDAVRNGFLGTATIKFYAGTSQERAREVLGSVWFLAIAITGILVLADAAFIPFIKSNPNAELVVTIKWFGLTFISSLPFNFMFWVLVAEEKYGKILWLRMINNGSMILYVLVLLMLVFAVAGDLIGIAVFKNLYGIAIASLFTVFSGIIFGYINLNKYLKMPLNDILSLGYAEMRSFLQSMVLKLK